MSAQRIIIPLLSPLARADPFTTGSKSSASLEAKSLKSQTNFLQFKNQIL